MRTLTVFCLALVLLATGAAADVWNAAGCLQRQLNALGYGPVTEDGQIGPETRAALARYEAVVGVLPARELRRETAIIYCRKLGLRHSTARQIWPAAAAPWQVVADPEVPEVAVRLVHSALRVMQDFLRAEVGVEIAGPFILVIGRDRESIADLAAAYLPEKFTRSGTLYDLTRTCAGPYVAGLSYPGLIMLCLPKNSDRMPRQVSNDIRWVVSHELVHEVQWQMTGRVSQKSDSVILAERGPGWLIEGTAEVLSNRRMTVDDAMWYFRRVRDLSSDMSRDLAELELYGQAQSAGDRLYVVGAGAASQLAIRESGLPGLVAFYDQLGEGTPWPEAFTETFGITYEKFQDRWAILLQSP